MRRPRKTLLVFCEGRRTEPEYLDALKREPSVRQAAAVDLRVERRSSGSVPLTLVNLASDAVQRSHDEEGEIDEVWCLFDVEWPKNHPGLQEAIDKARRSGVHLAITNPCFELWLALHFQEQSAWLENDAAERLRHSCDGSSDKGLDGRLYMPLRLEAARRAVALEARHRDNGTPFPDNNPSSGMYRLLESIELKNR